MGWVSLSANFRWKGTSTTNLRWDKKTRMITLSCGIKILAVCSSFVTKDTCDGHTDGRTDGWNYDPQYCASIAASCNKNIHKQKSQFIFIIHCESKKDLYFSFITLRNVGQFSKFFHLLIQQGICSFTTTP